MGTGGADLSRLAARLRAAGTEGQGLRRNLMTSIEEAAKPLAQEIADTAHLEEYMPNRYAATLSGDLSVKVQRSFSGDPKVTIRAKAREHRRKVKLLDNGLINHPVYARGPRRKWNWSNRQTGGMRAGFFRDVAKDHAPEIREKVMAALTETAGQIAGG